ncbi:NUDIX hydrolase [Paenibacillus lutimineralis]|uniref:NUDIX domain-containing protein n=1 Tax=Paenibacillus lutimineralis TaxID=2707005 RepID=A0A3Q9IAY8_9BACL|nr:NUDIX domain-containing protein [Paenibacillus lutimineralis]AZS16573.1 NUDIX domain-containing protein [Paenibacillus lutimineralis]
MRQWYELNEINHDLLKFAVLIAKYNNQFIIINNEKRGGWEVPGGTREIGETILHTASRELYEETGAVRFELTPFGIYQLNGSFGMVFFAEVEEMSTLPGFEIEEIKFEDDLPEGMNFGDLYYSSYDRWNERKDKRLEKYAIDIKNLDEVNEIVILV